MKATSESTRYDDQQLARRLPPALLRTVLAYENELGRLRAAQPDHAHARQCRTNALEALVLLALDNDRLRVDVMDATRCRRTKMVRDHLREFKDRYEIKKPPSHDSVRKVLIKHGYV